MIQIQLITYKGKPPSQPLMAQFDELGGRIGRGEGNHLVLHDPERSISRIHAAISFNAGRYYIRALGRALPVYLNDQPLTNEQDMPIFDGDQIRIGDYVMQVKEGAASESVSGELASPSKNATAQQDFASDSHLMDELLGNPRDRAKEPVSSENSMLNAKSTNDAASSLISKIRSPSNSLPLDFDPFEDLLKDNQLPNTNTTSSGTSEILQPELESKDDHPHIDSIISSDKSLADSPNSPDSVDPMVLMGYSPSDQSLSHPPIPDDVPEIKGSLPSLRMKEEAEKTSTIQNENPVATQPISSHEELLRAFLKGAGVPDLAESIELTPELMSLIGELLRESTQGTLDLLHARTLTKQEMHAEMTMIAPKENNPLKFSPSVEAALDHLLAPKARGFMPPLQAIKDTYDDLRSHQFGFMAGMRAALSGLLEKFNPERLEQRLIQKTLIDSVFPPSRKAKLWSLFTERYSTISQEAQEDFHIVFGKEFLRAYEAQIAKLGKDNKKR
ncbi:type VI secretion system-associated FHA domain protein TagH [Nitrosomonas communis]|uniref:FHA domain-containing protein n=1 Tax=Nitrosomonas communis TaxID=44574 RepID=A0A1H2V4V4_9PROT|nr:type VI secretion system-associated FHA domain protein TagH [Nitrosomonas communis]SDW63327.1 FHA domain-containing protein [Nitrosomonas communis]